MLFALLACAPDAPEPIATPDPSIPPELAPTGQWVLTFASDEGDELTPHRMVLVAPDASDQGVVYVQPFGFFDEAEARTVTVTRRGDTLTVGPGETSRVAWEPLVLRMDGDGTLDGRAEITLYAFGPYWTDWTTAESVITGRPDDDARVSVRRPPGPLFPWDTTGIEVHGLEPLAGIDTIRWTSHGSQVASSFSPAESLLPQAHLGTYTFHDLEWGDVLVPDLDGLADRVGNPATHDAPSFEVVDPPLWDGTPLQSADQAFTSDVSQTWDGWIPDQAYRSDRVWRIRGSLVLRTDVEAGQTLHLDVAPQWAPPDTACGIDVRVDGELTELYRAPAWVPSGNRLLTPLSHTFERGGELAFHAWCAQEYDDGPGRVMYVHDIRVK
ncbi:MAG: hypothetical protein H6736_13320 [Alphaproteobacteria bacterium]|nr:hypothetical protein [Alphaproteobacteria bacterium]MCB9692784.1 hypothetical protein [Alphaproteobacteria bacterium]